jgi:HPt (histidine-containing phosphotransfer) domain-containing protein
MRVTRQVSEGWTSRAIEDGDFASYQAGIMHDWLRTLTLLATVLVPLFFVLDLIMMPPALYLRFGIYRGISTVLALAQFLLVRLTRPSRWSAAHGYFIALQVGGIVALMTRDLGGFASTYYAGLNLVVIGVNLLMPWRGYHTALNAAIILLLYLGFNLYPGRPVNTAVAANNLFFLCATAVIAASISEARFRLIRKEFTLLVQVRRGRDELARSQRSLKGLLDVSGQGFLSFNRELCVGPDYSRECVAILGEDLEGRPIDTLLFADAKARRDFRNGLGLYFRGAARPDVVFDLLDSRLTIADRTVRAEYKAVDEDTVMAVLTDISEEVRREERERAENEKKAMILKVISHRGAFSTLERDARDLLTALANGALRAEPGSPEADEVARSLHTFKGDAGFLEFRQTQRAAHELEQALADRSLLGEQFHPEQHVEHLAAAFRREQTVISENLGRAWVARADSVEIPREEFTRLETHVRAHHPDDQALADALASHGRQRVRDLLQRFPPMVAELAVGRGKQVAPLAVSGGEGIAASEAVEEVVAAFAHILRNMVDHGIEHASERTAKGKPGAGTLRIQVEDQPGEIVFTLSDDGRGVSLEEVERKARSLGLLADGQDASPEQLLALIFQERVTTSAAVSLVSGRGIGLAAVRQGCRSTVGRSRFEAPATAARPSASRCPSRPSGWRR